jgi:hypothetical protein
VPKENSTSKTPVYEQLAAEQLIAARTGESPEDVRLFLEKRFRYQELGGIVRPNEDPEVEAERELHSDIMDRELHSDIIWADLPRQEDQNNVLEYVARTTSLDRKAIAAMYAEEVAYEVSLGIMEAGAYPYFRSWANAVAEEEVNHGTI